LKPTPAAPPAKSRPDAVLLDALNAARAAEGRHKLRREPRLDAIALAHAKQMRAKKRVAHNVGLGGPHARVAAAGVRVRLLGENVAKAANAKAAHDALWASPSHRQNLLTLSFRYVGVAALRDQASKLWVVQLFAR